MRTIVIVGGTSGVGRAFAAACLADGDRVVVSGRDAGRAGGVAAELAAAHGGEAYGIGTDLRDPAALRTTLPADLARAGVGTVDTLVLAGVARDLNTVRDYDIARATELATVKVVGYTAVTHLLRDRLAANGSVLLFGGVAKDVPYPGSTTVTTVNAAVAGLVTTLAAELAPVRVNALHLGLVGDSPFWRDHRDMLEREVRNTLTARLTTTADAVDACRFLTTNPAANRVSLRLDGGFH